MTEFDGFISKRQDGTDFALDLRANLLTDYQVSCSIQNRLGDIDDTDHVNAAQKAIEASKFVVVIVGENFFESPSEDRVSFQQMEVEHAFKVRRSRKRNGGSLGIFFVYLIDEPRPTDYDLLYEAIDDLRLGNSREAHVINAPRAPNLRDGRTNAIYEIASKIRDFLRTIEDEADARGVASEAVLIPENLQQFEQDYLFDNIDNWPKGHLGDIERVGGHHASDEARTQLFDFRRERELVLRASVQRTAGTRSDTPDKPQNFPVIERILSTDNKMCFVTGPAGSGKTTQLTLSAALLAFRLDPTMSESSEEWLSSNIAKSVKFKAGQEKFFPIVIECSSLGEKMPEADTQASTYYAVLLEHLSIVLGLGDASGNGSGLSIKEYLKTRDFAFFFDALDEVVSKENQRGILSAIKSLQRDLSRTKFDVLITVSARELFDDEDDFVELRLVELDDEQIADYFDRFSKGFAQNQSEQEHLSQLLFERFSGDDQLTELLRRPFNLNCFCYLAQSSGANGELPTIPSDQTGLIYKIILNLTEGINLPTIAGRELSGEILRSVLRRLAFDVLSGDERGKISIEEAEERVRHTLSTIFSLQTQNSGFNYIQRDEVSQLLQQIVSETDLLRVERNSYAFERQRFCEYLAAERIDMDALAVNFILALDLDSLPQLKDSFAFCYALRLKSHVFTSARRILESLLHRVRDEVKKFRDERDENGLAKAIEWLRAAIYCANAGAELRIDQESAFVEESGLRSVLAEGANQLSAFGDLMEPVVREEVLGSMMALCKDRNVERTVSNVWTVISSLTDFQERWQSFPGSFVNSGSDTGQKYMVARCPVLVCEYQMFVDAFNADRERLIDAGIWDHAPEDYIKTLDAEDIIGRTEASGAEHWRRLRQNLGHPMSLINWYEAVAYARWLTWVGRRQSELLESECVRLPTRDEMSELLISAADGGRYPWGDELTTKSGTRVNYQDSGIRGISTVGAFKAHKNYIDLGSNVQTWSIDTSADGKPLWPPEPSTESAQPMMGSSWFCHYQLLDADAKPEKAKPSRRDARFGVRLVQTNIQ